MRLQHSHFLLGNEWFIAVSDLSVYRITVAAQCEILTRFQHFWLLTIFNYSNHGHYMRGVVLPTNTILRANAV